MENAFTTAQMDLLVKTALTVSLKLLYLRSCGQKICIYNIDWLEGLNLENLFLKYFFVYVAT